MLEEEGGQEVVRAGEVPPGCTHLITSYDYDDPACESARQAKVAVVRALWVEHCMRHGPISPHRVRVIIGRRSHLCSPSGAFASQGPLDDSTTSPSLHRVLLAHSIVSGTQLEQNDVEHQVAVLTSCLFAVQVVYEPPRPSAPLAGAASLQISLTGYKGIYRATIMVSVPL